MQKFLPIPNELFVVGARFWLTAHSAAARDGDLAVLTKDVVFAADLTCKKPKIL